jgi:hypothetical protein
VCGILIAIGAVAVIAKNTGRPVGASPLHVAAVFFDGINNLDFRQTCGVWQAGRQHMQECEGWLAFRAALGGPEHYTVVAHSTKEWREGDVSVASVKVRGPYGVVLTVRLVKTRANGWLVVSAA